MFRSFRNVQEICGKRKHENKKNNISNATEISDISSIFISIVKSFCFLWSIRKLEL